MNYFRYIPMSLESRPWGISVTAAGFTRIKPGMEYPPPGHPIDRAFSFAMGRTLGTFQIVFVLDGTGTFESASCPARAVTAGSVFLLFPREWHRYQPDRGTGWVESWLEIDGRIVRRLLQERLLDPRLPVHVLRRRARFEALLEQIHARLRDESSGFDPELSAAALGLVAQIVAEQHLHSGPPTAVEQVVTRAQAMLAEASHQNVPIPEVARSLGIGYSHFRREFTRLVGYAPKQYRDRIRLERARRMLGGTALGLAAIADQLGYASPYHLSAAFKREFGISPAHWRRSVERPPC